MSVYNVDRERVTGGECGAGVCGRITLVYHQHNSENGCPIGLHN